MASSELTFQANLDLSGTALMFDTPSRTIACPPTYRAACLGVLDAVALMSRGYGAIRDDAAALLKLSNQVEEENKLHAPSFVSDFLMAEH